MSDKFVKIFEVGPRDGLQNEEEIIPTNEKIELIDAFSDLGFKNIEATAFVSPKWVPQMADSSDVMAGINRNPNVRYSALTPNLQGFEKALDAKVDEVAVFASASETFSQKNINCSIAESLERFVPLMERARHHNIPVRGYVSCVVGCPYEGEIKPQAVADVSNALMELGCYEVSLGDTIGVGTPQSTTQMLKAVQADIDPSKLAGHYHDTKGVALDNVKASLDMGLRVFDSAIGGLGGCPYAPGAKGNVSTLALVQMLEADGWSTELDLDGLVKVETIMAKLARQNHA
ncbi:MAG: hydroxymethylglutaryl-CoA lyase [Rhizobiaceae bacterium]|nr:hydroxymethylglutaryl-CoA lyase [Rhizobiaceae bacterium]